MTDLQFGHIKLSRKAFDPDKGDPFWHEHRKFSRWEAWVYVLQLAAFAPRRFQTAHGAVDLERGEFVASLRHMASHFMWSFKSVRGWVGLCEKGARLRAQRETQAGTVYLIVNYDTYQSQNQTQGTAKGTLEGTGRAQAGHKRESSKAGKALTTSPVGDVDRVIGHYLTLHPRRRPGDKERRIVERRLATYSADELCEALSGNANDDWHRQKGKHDLEYVLRDNGKIDDFRSKAQLTAVRIEDGWFAA